MRIIPSANTDEEDKWVKQDLEALVGKAQTKTEKDRRRPRALLA